MFNINNKIKEKKEENLKVKIEEILTENLNNLFDIEFNFLTGKVVCTLKKDIKLDRNRVDLKPLSFLEIKRKLKKSELELMKDSLEFEYYFKNLNSKKNYDLFIQSENNISLDDDMYELNNVFINSKKLNIRGDVKAINFIIKTNSINLENISITTDKNLRINSMKSINILNSNFVSKFNNIELVSSIINTTSSNLNAPNGRIDVTANESFGFISKDKKSIINTKQLDISSYYLDLAGASLYADIHNISSLLSRFETTDLNFYNGYINCNKIILINTKLIGTNALILCTKDNNDLSNILVPILIYNGKVYKDKNSIKGQTNIPTKIKTKKFNTGF